MARAVVELAGCTRDYGGIRAVAGLDLVVYEGELLSLLGPSGCGKTTTLNLIAGAWIQFEVHDWLSHDPEKSNAFTQEMISAWYAAPSHTT